MSSFNIKTNRTFTLIRKYGFTFTLLVAIAGLKFPKLGLLVIPVILGLTLYSFFKGRYWCGNICAHGSLFDSALLRFSRNKKIPQIFRSRFVYIPFFLFFSFKIVRGLIRVSAIYGSAKYFDKMGFIFVSSYIMVTLLGGGLALVFAPRTWCGFCPMGVIQKLSNGLGRKLGVTKFTEDKITVINKDMCHSCGKCSRVCPMQLVPYVDFDENNQFEHPNCIKCSTCVYNCPAHILTLSNLKTAEVVSKNVDTTGFENRQKISTKISNIKEMPNDIIEYTFEFIKPKSVNYKSGQFILVKIQEDPVMFRAYSISSFNKDGSSLSVTIKKAPNGYGTDIIFKDFKLGDSVELEGPMGRDLLVDKDAEKVLLIGGGIGITPFIPIITDLSSSDYNGKAILLYGANKEEEFIYNDEFNSLDGQFNNFEMRRVVAFEDEYSGRKGFVTDHMEDIPEIEDYKVYMCGPPPMVNAAKKKLLSLGVKDSNIKYESA